MATNVKRKKKAEVMEDDGSMTLTGHLKELRNRLIICAVVFVVSVVITLMYADRLIDILTAMGQGYYTFVSIAPQEKLMQYFRVSLLAAFVITVPVALYQIYAFAKPGWLKKLDDLLTCRISLAWAAYRMFDIKIAGQFLQEWPALDNIFVYLLYLTGPVMVVLVCALMMAALYGYARRGAWQTVACLVTMLAYGYMESQVIHLTSDPAVLLLCGAVFALPRDKWMFEDA